MADNVTFQTTAAATPPDATTVATDDVGGAQYQRIKIDGGGNGVAVPIVAGQQARAASVPVALSTEDVAALTPPAAIAGFATAANQATQITAEQAILAKLLAAPATEAKQDTGNTSLSSIDGKLPALVSSRVPVDGSGVTQPVSGTVTANIGTVATLATAAKQDTGNTSVASIDTKTPALGQAVAAASVPVILPSATITTLTPPAAITGFATEAKQDTQVTALGGLTETAPGTDTASSGLNGRLQRIAQRLTSLITALGSPFQAGGSIGNTTFASTQSGTWNITNVSGTVSLPTGAATAAKQPALGTAGAASTDVITVQGIASGVAQPASQSGTWTVQPGNTPNTTAWLVKEQRSATPTQSSVADTATSTTLLASNSARLGATVYNDSTAVLYLKLGATASATSFTVAMAAASYYEVPFAYTGIIDGIWASDAGGSARITELA